MLIKKFGGSSVGNVERIKNLKQFVQDNGSQIIVLSAMSGTTNSLVEIASALYAKENSKAILLIDALQKKYHQVVDELYTTHVSKTSGNELVQNHFEFIRSFTLDMFTENEEKAILAQGELLSTALVHYYFEEVGIKSVLLSALNFMRIDENDEPDLSFIEINIKNEIQKYDGETLFITQGYICRNPFGEIDNLKRGGSDYTATIIGAVLRANEIQIWTDIDGMHNNDPRIVEKTFPIKELSYDEAAELAYFGAKILHPTCVLPAQKRNVPVRLLNTMQPEAPGTIIKDIKHDDGITAVAAKDGITVVKIKSGRMLLAYGFLRMVFEIFELYKTPIDMISTSEVAVSLTIDNPKYLKEIVADLQKLGSVEVDIDLSIVCIVGSFGADKQGYAFRIFEALKNIPVRMISYGGSENNISLLVKTEDKNNTLIALNNGLFAL